MPPSGGGSGGGSGGSGGLDPSFYQQTGAISKTVAITQSKPDGTTGTMNVNIGTAVVCTTGPDGSSIDPNATPVMYICSYQLTGFPINGAGGDTSCVAFADEAYCQAAAEGQALSILQGIEQAAGVTFGGLDGLQATPALPASLGGP